MATYNLDKCPLFAGLQEQELETLALYATPMEFRVAEQLFQVGDPADSFYLILRGSVKINVPASGAEPAKTVMLREGAFFGEIGLVRECPRTAAAFAENGSKLIRIPRDAFQQFMQRDARIARKIALAILDRLNEFQASDDQRRDAKEPEVLMVVSPGGQEGASFLGANLAVKFRMMTKLPVLALDLNFGNQGLWRYLETMSNLGHFDEIFTCNYLTADVISRSTAKVHSGVQLLSGIDAEMTDAIRPRHAHDLIKAAREPFEYIIVDPGHAQDALRAEVAKSCDAALIVCTATEASITQADAHATWLKGLGLDGRIRFVINKVTPDPEVDPAAIKEVLGDDLLGTIHKSSTQTQLGRQSSAPVVAARPQSELATEVSRIAQVIREGEMLNPPGALGKMRDLVLWGLGFTD